MKTKKNFSSASIIFDMFGVLFQKEFSNNGRIAIVPIEDGVQLLHELATRVDDSGKRTNRCYLLTNASNTTITQLSDQYPELFALFEGIVTSQDVGYAKPDARMYHHLIDNYHLNDQPGVFIDDTLENVIAAEQCGLTGVQWTNGSAVRSVLRGLGVLR